MENALPAPVLRATQQTSRWEDLSLFAEYAIVARTGAPSLLFCQG